MPSMENIIRKKPTQLRLAPKARCPHTFVAAAEEFRCARPQGHEGNHFFKVTRKIREAAATDSPDVR